MLRWWVRWFSQAHHCLSTNLPSWQVHRRRDKEVWASIESHTQMLVCKVLQYLWFESRCRQCVVSGHEALLHLIVFPATERIIPKYHVDGGSQQGKGSLLDSLWISLTREILEAILPHAPDIRRDPKTLPWKPRTSLTVELSNGNYTLLVSKVAYKGDFWRPIYFRKSCHCSTVLMIRRFPFIKCVVAVHTW